MAGHDVAEHPVLDFDHTQVNSLNLNALNKKLMMPGTVSPSEKTARSSFSSVRENDDGLAQTFTRSKVSSYINETEDVFDESPSLEIQQPTYQPPLTQPNSKLHGFWVPAESFRGWREIPLKGRKASRSVENLRDLCMSWSPPPTPLVEKQEKKIVPTAYVVGQSPLETLPSEVLGKFLSGTLRCHSSGVW